jgi:perosamine synthetase
MSTIIPALAPLPPSTWLRRPADRPPFPLSEPGCRLFERARHALYRAVTELVEPGTEILAPAFHHGSEIEAFERAGLVCRFYEATDTLAPNEDELESLVNERTRALHLVHYLGFPQDAARWRRWCDERGLLLVEDAAQAWLSDSVGRTGDVAVWCLYKTFGLPDGAALLTRAPTNGALPGGRRGLAGLALEHALWLATRARPVSWISDRRAPRLGTIDYTMGLGDPKPPSAATLAVLSRVADPAAADRRREHYRRYLELLGDLVPLPFAELPGGASPFMFPAVFQDKPKALERLRWHRVRALNFWSAPHPSLPTQRFPRALELRRTVVGLPVHQELRPRDVDRVAGAVRATLRG